MKPAKFIPALPLLALCLGLAACKGPIPVDVVLDGGDVYFLLENPEAVSSIRVTLGASQDGPNQPVLMWEARHDMTTPLKQRKYPAVKQIRYGQKFEELPVTVGPVELTRDMEYVVTVEIGKTFAQESFKITADNKVVMPNPAFARQRGRAYTVLTDKDGNKTFVRK